MGYLLKLISCHVFGTAGSIATGGEGCTRSSETAHPSAPRFACSPRDMDKIPCKMTDAEKRSSWSITICVAQPTPAAERRITRHK
jgi:hypothetical protein